MTYQEFENIASNRKRPDTPGFYKLEWYMHISHATYKPHDVEGGHIWLLNEHKTWNSELHEYYPSFAEAYSAMMQKIGTPSLYGFVISKLGYGPLGTEDFYIHFRSYDSKGKRILKSVCSSYHYGQPGLEGKFLGRDEKSSRIKLGDIVLISRIDTKTSWKQTALGIVVGLPKPVRHYWNLYQEDVESNGPEYADKKWFEDISLVNGAEDDEFFIQFGPYDDDLSNFTFKNSIELHVPVLRVPEEAQNDLRRYYADYLK